MHRYEIWGDRLHGAFETLAVLGLKALIRGILDDGRVRPKLALVPAARYKKCWTIAGRGL